MDGFWDRHQPNEIPFVTVSIFQHTTSGAEVLAASEEVLAASESLASACPIRKEMR